MLAVGPEYGFGLYVHWPYCARICPYCDFNVYAAKDRDTAPLLDAIVQDIFRHRDALPDHPELDSVFLGGGTPSLLNGDQMARIVEAAKDAFGLRPGAEITLEANPNDILIGRPDAWRKAGVNRLSIGIQSLEDEALEFLGRDHDAAGAIEAVKSIQPMFENHSIDLIYARPGQSETDWSEELKRALDLGAPHLSLYELTIETRTAFGKRAARGELVPMLDDEQADLYERTQDICEAAGLMAYEVSNHARAPELESRHNHIYWASGDWIGVGPGAHGRLTIDGVRHANEAARRPADYISQKQTTVSTLSTSESAREYLAMALRPLAGMNLARFESLFGNAPAPETIEDLIENGYATLDDNTLKLTIQGRLIADYVASLLVPY
ncbi:MAG: radical SAM family heme chaperone HemW [Pseudomonadota bacterium]|nr:radical SAM family heme chaperone HemW [Pseudomonadota bacterium]